MYTRLKIPKCHQVRVDHVRNVLEELMNPLDLGKKMKANEAETKGQRSMLIDKRDLTCDNYLVQTY